MEEGARGSPKSGDKDAALLLDTLEQAVEMVRLRQAMVLVYAALLGSSAAPDLLDLASQVLAARSKGSGLGVGFVVTLTLTLTLTPALTPSQVLAVEQRAARLSAAALL